MAQLTPRERTTLLIVAAVYAAVVIVIRRHIGGDIVPGIAQSEQLLEGKALYTADQPATGTPWPPFSGLALVPFALLARTSLPLATACWSAASVACLAWSIARARRWGWRPVLLGLAAVAVPLQTNFEHRNINTVLLALVIAGTTELEERRDVRAGLWFGLATALKAFPALLLVYLAYRRRWRALVAGLSAAAGLTLLALAPSGPAGAATAVQTWLTLTFDPARWPLGSSNQSLLTLVTRLGAPPLAATALVFACLAAVAVVLRRPAGERRAPYEVGMTMLVAVLATPIAWVHYYVLAFPAWVAAVKLPIPRAGLGLAGLATSGLLTVGPRPLRSALLNNSVYTWGALLLLVLLIFSRTAIEERHAEAG